MKQVSGRQEPALKASEAEGSNRAPRISACGTLLADDNDAMDNYFQVHAAAMLARQANCMLIFFIIQLKHPAL